jgi:hypothetical protein
MIASESFSKEWIAQFRIQKGFPKVNPPILEKMIHMQIKSYLITGVFRIDEAIEAAAKAAFMAAKIKTRNNEPLEIFDKKRDINDYLIKDQPHNYLNKLKKLPNGALFYWNHALKLKKV